MTKIEFCSNCPWGQTVENHTACHHPKSTRGMYDPISGDYVRLIFKNSTPGLNCPLPDHILGESPSIIFLDMDGGNESDGRLGP